MTREEAIQFFNDQYGIHYMVQSLKEYSGFWFLETADQGTGLREQDGTCYRVVIYPDKVIEKANYQFTEEAIIEHYYKDRELSKGEVWSISISSKRSMLGLRKFMPERTVVEINQLIETKPLAWGEYKHLKQAKIFLEENKVDTIIEKFDGEKQGLLSFDQISYDEDSILILLNNIALN